MKDQMFKVYNKAVWTAKAGLSPSAQIENLHYKAAIDPLKGGEYARKVVGPAYIEPVFGYIVTEQGCLLEDSMTANASNDHLPWRQGTPSFADFYRSIQRGGARVAEYKTVISLRHWWEWNFYHFFHDVLGKMHMMEVLGLPESTPLVLGSYAGELEFAKQTLSRGKFADRNWVIQGQQYIKADEIYYCRTKESLRARMDYILDHMDIPVPASNGGEKIYLKRGSGAKRTVANSDEVEAVARAHGFRIVDTDGMELSKQIALFANTRHLLAAHGAGMTNIIYRRSAPLSILELQPATWRNRCFERLAKDYGHSWESIVGIPVTDKPKQHADYYIPPVELNSRLERMLADEEIEPLVRARAS